METPGFLLFDFSAENGLEAISVNYYYYIHGEKIWIKILVGFFSSNKSGLINEKKRKKYNSNWLFGKNSVCTCVCKQNKSRFYFEIAKMGGKNWRRNQRAATFNFKVVIVVIMPRGHCVIMRFLSRPT